MGVGEAAAATAAETAVTGKVKRETERRSELQIMFIFWNDT